MRKYSTDAFRSRSMSWKTHPLSKPCGAECNEGIVRSTKRPMPLSRLNGVIFDSFKPNPTSSFVGARRGRRSHKQDTAAAHERDQDKEDHNVHEQPEEKAVPSANEVTDTGGQRRN